MPDVVDVNAGNDVCTVRHRSQLDDATADHSPVDTEVDLLDTGHGPPGQPAEHRLVGGGAAVLQPQGQRALGLAGRGRAAAKLAGWAPELRAHDVVELPDAGEARAERD